MSEQPGVSRSDAPVTGQSARRRFLKQSGTVAVAAPTAALLLSATRANAQRVPPPYLDNLDDN